MIYKKFIDIELSTLGNRRGMENNMGENEIWTQKLKLNILSLSAG